MNWSDLKSALGASAPLLGSLIGGPAGATIGAMIASALGVPASPEAVSQAVINNPDCAVCLRQIEAEQSVRLQELASDQARAELAAETARLQAINATMQAEARSEHWPQWGWRPFIGFITGIMVLGCYFILPLAKIPVPAVPETVWMMLCTILGVASWWRGKEKAGQ